MKCCSSTISSACRAPILLLVVASIVATVVARPRGGFVVDSRDHWAHNEIRKEANCGYESCPVLPGDMLNVHMVPHSHDDVGWLKTVDQYYYGSKTNHQRAGVQYILDSVVQELLKDPTRRFIYVESAFFFKWWDEQTPELQQAVWELVQEGRLEFVGGAWSMNDEAASHYQSLIDQFTWGLRLLNDTFGECGRPRAGWQIDPFGHSREQASLFAQMGYDGTFFSRLDWNDKTKRLADKTAEMIWKSSSSLEDNELFTAVLYNHYSAPPGFCFDVLCSDDPFVDGPNSAENNVNEKVDTFLNFVNTMQTRYRSNNLILTFGDDFNYMDATMNFKNMDKLIKYVNARQLTGSKVNLFYSTPTCYLKALNEAQLTWPTKSDDFFPYASDPHAYWTGYFTSRPTSKRFERIGNHFLQVCKQLTAFAAMSNVEYDEAQLTILRDAIGVMQHHDAITGTEKQHVADDYARMLHAAIDACEVNTNAGLSSLMTPDESPLKFESCRMLNISQCEVSESKESFAVTLYNSMGHSIYHHVRLPVNGNRYVVRDSDGVEVPVQMVSLPETLTNLVSRTSIATQELVFTVDEVPPMGFKSFYVSESYEAKQSEPKERENQRKRSVSIGNNRIAVNFDENGFLSTIVVEEKEYRLQQNFLYYEGAYGNNAVFENRSSGAYIFRPNGTEQTVTNTVQLRVVLGDLVEEVHQVFNEWISQVVRVYRNEQHVEFEWMVGPIPIDDDKGKEIISRFYSDIQSDGVFWTDANGREMIERKRDYRETWDLNVTEAVAGNYYPVTTRIALEDSQARMALLNDRAQGGTSMEDGVLELMLHRRLLRDDAFGVGEALNESAYGEGLVARGKLYLLFDTKQTEAPTIQARERFLQNQIHTPAWVFLSDETDQSFDTWRSKYRNYFSGIFGTLPLNINLLTFEPWREPYTFLVRFEHLFEQGEDSKYSEEVTFNLQELFIQFNIISIRETTLAGNQWKEDSTRLKFYADPVPIEQKSTISTKAHRLLEGSDITLGPMEIRTFVIEMRWK